jgi:hypothetical protein
MMEIVKINILSEIPKDIIFRTYCAEPSPEAAVQYDRQKYGSDPKIVYHRIQPSRRSTVYIPINPSGFIIDS